MKRVVDHTGKILGLERELKRRLREILGVEGVWYMHAVSVDKSKGSTLSVYAACDEGAATEAMLNSFDVAKVMCLFCELYGDVTPDSAPRKVSYNGRNTVSVDYAISPVKNIVEEVVDVTIRLNVQHDANSGIGVCDLVDSALTYSMDSSEEGMKIVDSWQYKTVLRDDIPVHPVDEDD